MHPGQAQICDNDAYIVGTSNVKKDTSKSHSRSKFHLSAVQATLPLVEKSKLAQQFQTMQDRTKAKMSKLFDIAYMVAHCEQPFTMYKQFVLLEKKHGVDLGVTYINDAACRTFIHHIAATIREDLEKLFGQEPFYFSLLFDGSTDKSISEKEVVSIKLIEDGIPKIKVLGIAEPERCDAPTVEQAIRKLCEDHNLNLKNGFVASAADGAAVNFGERSGILTRFQREDAPWLIKMHCIAHRLELALKDAFKNTYYVLEPDGEHLDLWKLLGNDSGDGVAYDDKLPAPQPYHNCPPPDHTGKSAAPAAEELDINGGARSLGKRTYSCKAGDTKSAGAALEDAGSLDGGIPDAEEGSVVYVDRPEGGFDVAEDERDDEVHNRDGDCQEGGLADPMEESPIDVDERDDEVQGRDRDCQEGGIADPKEESPIDVDRPEGGFDVAEDERDDEVHGRDRDCQEGGIADAKEESPSDVDHPEGGFAVAEGESTIKVDRQDGGIADAEDECDVEVDGRDGD
eukprot:XP_011662209.1 PREDICTED: uncharacterized protein LOC105437382 [Strongylocentrotus purpuratus]